MALIVADCPRCRSKKITFDVLSMVHVRTEFDWLLTYEGFSVCRNCSRPTIFLIRVSNYEFAKGEFGNKPERFPSSLMPFVDAINRYISLRDMGVHKAPDHCPSDVAGAFNEASTCLAVECWNAAAAMFRKSLDLATRPMLPAADENGLNRRIRRDLGLRLPWLFEQKILPTDLRELSSCIREDGNNGAHAGDLNKIDAEDLMDFTEALLERIFTEPERLRIAQQRRAERRKPSE
jgi:hypothetical protein